MSSQPAGWRVSRAAWPVIVPAIGAEAFSNALRAYGLGAHLHDFTVTTLGHRVSLAGAVLVLAALAVSLSQARAAWVAVTPGPLRQRIVCGGAAALLLAISITSMVALILEAQRAKSGHEGTDRAAYERADAAYKAAKADFDRVADVRPVDVVDKEIMTETAAILADEERRPIWRRTGQCADISRPASAAACATILRLRQEIAGANARAGIEDRYTKTQAALAPLSRPEHASVSETSLEWIGAWLVGFGVVFLATFGTVIFARVETPSANHESSPFIPDSAPMAVRSSPVAVHREQSGAPIKSPPLDETDFANIARGRIRSPSPIPKASEIPSSAFDTPASAAARPPLDVAKRGLKTAGRGEQAGAPARAPRSMAERIAAASAPPRSPVGATRLPESVPPGKSESFPETVVATFPERVPARLPATLPGRIPANRDDADLLAVLVAAPRPLSNAELAAAWGVSEGEASKRVSALGPRVRRVKIGRGVQITLAGVPRVAASKLDRHVPLH